MYIDSVLLQLLYFILHTQIYGYMYTELDVRHSDVL